MLRMVDVFVVEFLSPVAVIVDRGLIPIIGKVGRVVVVAIDDGLAGLAYSKVAWLSEELA